MYTMLKLELTVIRSSRLPDFLRKVCRCCSKQQAWNMAGGTSGAFSRWNIWGISLQKASSPKIASLLSAQVLHHRAVGCHRRDRSTKGNLRLPRCHPDPDPAAFAEHHRPFAGGGETWPTHGWWPNLPSSSERGVL